MPVREPVVSQLFGAFSKRESGEGPSRSSVEYIWAERDSLSKGEKRWQHGDDVKGPNLKSS